MQQVAVLGATGSIGASALDVIARHPDRLQPSVLAAGRQIDALLGLCRQHRPAHAVIADEALYPALRDGLRDAGLATQAHAGMRAIDALAASDACEIVVAAIVGAAGLSSTLAAARAGKRLLLANKESLVMAGDLLMAAAREGGATIIPIDSEHNAIFQCLSGCSDASELSRITLTASGGPFRGRSRDSLARVTPAQAVAHPKWSMGPKISVDSATLMNKGLELIEAHHLFGLGSKQIDVVIHRQSTVHSLVEFIDGSLLAQLGTADMRIPIAYALSWPERMETPAPRLDLVALGRLDFEAPDLDRFPALRLAREALESGGGAAIILNAANEIAVELFLAGRIGFTGIAAMVTDALAQSTVPAPGSIDEVIALDSATRARVSATARESCP